MHSSFRSFQRTAGRRTMRGNLQSGEHMIGWTGKHGYFYLCLLRQLVTNMKGILRVTCCATLKNTVESADGEI